jgi:hypothetical protein
LGSLAGKTEKREMGDEPRKFLFGKASIRRRGNRPRF